MGLIAVAALFTLSMILFILGLIVYRAVRALLSMRVVFKPRADDSRAAPLKPLPSQSNQPVISDPD